MSETPMTPEREQAVRAETLAEVVAWLVKKAREERARGPQHARQADVIGVLASKVERGAVRPDNLCTLPPGEEPAPEDVPALRAENARLRAQRHLLLEQLRRKDAASGAADRALEAFLAADAPDTERGEGR
jgi:hypothetical protein